MNKKSVCNLVKSPKVVFLWVQLSICESKEKVVVEQFVRCKLWILVVFVLMMQLEWYDPKENVVVNQLYIFLVTVTVLLKYRLKKLL